MPNPVLVPTVSAQGRLRLGAAKDQPQSSLLVVDYVEKRYLGMLLPKTERFLTRGIPGLRPHQASLGDRHCLPFFLQRLRLADSAMKGADPEQAAAYEKRRDEEWESLKALREESWDTRNDCSKGIRTGLQQSLGWQLVCQQLRYFETAFLALIITM